MRVSKAFSGSTQLVGLALEGVTADRPLFALSPDPGLPQLFGEAFPGAHYLYHDYAVYRRDRDAAGAPSEAALSFGPRWEASDELHDLAVVYLPRSRDEIEFALSAVSEALAPGARVMIVGPNRSGIRSSRPQMATYFGAVLSSRSARHCVLIEAERTASAPQFEGRKAFDVQALGATFHVVSLPGVFSHGELDEGTSLLLEHIESPAFERALDFGCGAGMIGTALALAHRQAEVNLVDSHVMAIEATRLTLEANGLSADRAWASDVFSDVHDQYDLIVSNPPFHTGHKTDFFVTEQFIHEAGGHLTRNGRLVIVVNAFINYHPHLREGFGSVRTIAETNRYRVIEARRAGMAGRG